MTDAYVDDIAIVINGDDVAGELETYSIRSGVFDLPGTFTCTLGNGVDFGAMAYRYPPMSPYRIEINGIAVQAGYITGLSRGGEGTSITFVGHTKLARLMLAEVEKTRTFKSPTYADLAVAAFEAAGLDMVLTADNIADTRATGKNVTYKKPTRGDGSYASQDVPGVDLKAEIGASWWTFLQQQFQLADLFLWDEAEGVVILSQPNVTNRPTLFSLVRRPGYSDILRDTFSSDMSKRHSECLVYAREGGGKKGVVKIRGRYIDEEMVRLLNPKEEDRKDGGVVRIPNAQRDKKVYSKEHADRLARRSIAAERRDAWALSYTVQGHTRESREGNRVLILPDTTFDILDEELGLDGFLWIESVEYAGTQTSTMTTFRAMRPEDLVFLVPEKKKKLKPKEKGVAAWQGPWQIVQGVGDRWIMVGSKDGKQPKEFVTPVTNTPVANDTDPIDRAPAVSPAPAAGQTIPSGKPPTFGE